MVRVAALLLLMAIASSASVASAAASSPAASPLSFDGDRLPDALTTTPGDPVRGRAIVANRQQGLCLLCHSGPFPEETSAGNLATDLTGTGARWSEAQLRARIVDARRLDPASLMPAFHAVGDRQRVAGAFAGKPILDAQQVEDVVAFLTTLK